MLKGRRAGGGGRSEGKDGVNWLRKVLACGGNADKLDDCRLKEDGMVHENDVGVLYGKRIRIESPSFNPVGRRRPRFTG